MDRYYDVIIVGCGVAGCFAALHLPGELKVLMITKSEIDESDSNLAQGGICVLRDDDDYDDFFEDTMRAGHYENRRESVDCMIRESREVINELVGYGVEFTKENGEFRYTREGGHGKNRILYHDDLTGKEITSKLLAAVQKLDNVTLLAHTEMVDIMTEKNRCDGVVIKTADGEFATVFAANILWACGGIGGIYKDSTNFPHLTGDTIALASKHGIRLQDVSYIQIHPTTLYSKKKERRFLISESVRGEGAHLLDKDGDRFVNELLPRDILTTEIRKQMAKDGTEHVWLSLLPITEVDVKERFPNIYKRCMEEGYDITKEPIPVVPAQHYFMGGVYVDINARTSMDHLYAAGEACCNGVHGANRLASNSLLESLVFAKHAAKHMMEDDFSNEAAHELRMRKLNNKLKLDDEEREKLYDLNMELYANTKAYRRDMIKRVKDEIESDRRIKAEKRYIQPEE